MSSCSLSSESSDEEDYKKLIKKMKRKLKKKKARSKKKYRHDSYHRRHRQDENEQDYDEEMDLDEEIQADMQQIEHASSSSAVQTTPLTDSITNPDNLLQDDQLKPVFLEALGKVTSEEKTWSPPIQKDIAVRWELIIKQGLPEEAVIQFLKENRPPENCKMMEPPMLNIPVYNILSEVSRNTDKKLCEKQNLLASSLSALGRALTIICKKPEEDEENIALVKIINDAARGISHSLFHETMTRKSIISRKVNSTMKDTLIKAETDTFLFGAKLQEEITTAKAVEKVSQELKQKFTPKPGNGFKPGASTSKFPKNSRCPPRQWSKQSGHKTSVRTQKSSTKEPKKDNQNSRRSSSLNRYKKSSRYH